MLRLTDVGLVVAGRLRSVWANQGDKGPDLAENGVGRILREQTRNLAFGLITGVVGGLLGVGGGLVLIPMLTGFLKLMQHKAHGTSLAVVSLTAITAAWRYSTSGYVDWRLAAIVAATSIMGAIVGARVCHFLPARQLRLVFAVFVLGVGVVMVTTGSVQGLPTAKGGVATSYALLEELGLGLITGLVSGVLGIGGGPILVPAFVFLLGLSQHAAQGVSMAVIAPTAIAGSYTHYRQGNVVASMVLGLAMGAVLGAIVGSEVATRTDATFLRRIFGLLLIFLSLQAFYKMRR